MDDQQSSMVPHPPYFSSIDLLLVCSFSIQHRDFCGSKVDHGYTFLQLEKLSSI